MSTISSGTTSTTTLIHSGDTTGSLVFKTNDTGSGGTTAMTIDTSQNVGIGVTPSAWQSTSSSRAIQFNGSYLYGYRDTNLIIGQNAYYDGTWKYYASSIGATQFNMASGTYSWSIAGSGTAGNAITWNQAMTLDSSGRLVIGNTSAFGSGNLQVQGGNLCMTINSGSFNYSFGTASNQFNVYDGGGTLKGYLTNAGTWTNTSDIAFKKDIVDIKYTLSDVLKLRPVSYVTKDYDIPQIGFIAQEMETVIPEVVSGEEGSKGISYGSITALLVKSIQELKALVDTQATEIAQLKAKV